MTRYLITGASGNLGRPLSALAAALADTTSIYYHNASIGGGRGVQIDLRDGAAVMSLVADVKPTVILHAAGSERSQDMIATNNIGAVNICQAAQRTHTRLIALSSDLVFDGKTPPYDEETPPTPLSPYGRVKAENERLFTTQHDDCLVVRTSLIYDLDPLNHQARWLQTQLDTHQLIPLFTDEIRQPIWAWNLAEILLELAGSPLTGRLNVAGPRSLSRWEYGCAMLRAMGYDPGIVAQPVAAAQVAPDRPRDCTLSLIKARSILKSTILDLEQGLGMATIRNRKTDPGREDSQAPGTQGFVA